MLQNKKLLPQDLMAHRGDLVFHFREILDSCGACVVVSAQGWYVTLHGDDLTKIGLHAIGMLIEYATRVEWSHAEDGQPLLTVYADVHKEQES